MTDNHPHMPPIKRTTARWLSPGQGQRRYPRRRHVLPWEEAKDLAEAICESLQLEVKP